MVDPHYYVRLSSTNDTRACVLDQSVPDYGKERFKRYYVVEEVTYLSQHLEVLFSCSVWGSGGIWSSILRILRSWMESCDLPHVSASRVKVTCLYYQKSRIGEETSMAPISIGYCITNLSKVGKNNLLLTLRRIFGKRVACRWIMVDLLMQCHE